MSGDSFGNLADEARGLYAEVQAAHKELSKRDGCHDEDFPLVMRCKGIVDYVRDLRALCDRMEDEHTASYLCGYYAGKAGDTPTYPEVVARIKAEARAALWSEWESYKKMCESYGRPVGPYDAEAFFETACRQLPEGGDADEGTVRGRETSAGARHVAEGEGASTTAPTTLDGEQASVPASSPSYDDLVEQMARKIYAPGEANPHPVWSNMQDRSKERYLREARRILALVEPAIRERFAEQIVTDPEMNQTLGDGEVNRILRLSGSKKMWTYNRDTESYELAARRREEE